MPKKEKKLLAKDAKKLMANRRLTEELISLIEEKRGSLGFLLNTLSRRHKTFNPYILKGQSVYREPEAIDQKTAELAAVSAATALRCEHCLEAHMIRAMEEGSSIEEIFDVILIAAAITESSTLSVAFRKYKHLEGKVKKTSAKGTHTGSQE